MANKNTVRSQFDRLVLRLWGLQSRQHSRRARPCLTTSAEVLEPRVLLAADSNDQFSEAIVLAKLVPNQPVTLNGTISEETDVDMFQFQANAGQTISFDIDTAENGAPGLGSYLRLFDSRGNELAANNDAQAPDEPRIPSSAINAGFDAYISYRFRSAGTYFIAVSNWQHRAYNPITGVDRLGSDPRWLTGSYSLTVKALDSGTPTDLIATKVAWSATNGGLALTYEIKGGALDTAMPVPVSLYWANGTSFNNRLGTAIPLNVAFPSGLGKHVVYVPGSALQDNPAGATHLLLVLNQDLAISESKLNNNVAAVRDVVVNVGAQGTLSGYSVDVIKDNLRIAGASSATITSLQRMPADQARVMFDNCFNDGIASQLNLYAPAGDTVVRVYESQTRGLTRTQILQNRVSIESAMLAQIVLVGPTNVSLHSADPTRLQVIDVAPSSLASGARDRFVGAVQSDPRIGRYIGPSQSDRAYHLEIPQS